MWVGYINIYCHYIMTLRHNGRGIPGYRPKLLSPVYIFPLFHVLFSLFGRLFIFFRFYCCTRRQNALLCKNSRKHTICMQWNFGVVSWCVCCKQLPVDCLWFITYLCLCSDVCIPSGEPLLSKLFLFASFHLKHQWSPIINNLTNQIQFCIWMGWETTLTYIVIVLLQHGFCFDHVTRVVSHPSKCKTEFDWSNYLWMETIDVLSGVKQTKII